MCLFIGLIIGVAICGLRSALYKVKMREEAKRHGIPVPKLKWWEWIV